MPSIKMSDFSKGLHVAGTETDAPEGYCRRFTGVSNSSVNHPFKRYGSSLIQNNMNAHSIHFYGSSWYYGVGTQLYRNATLVRGFSSYKNFRFAVMPASPGFPDYLYVCNGGGVRALTHSTERRWGISPPQAPANGTGLGYGALDGASTYRYAYTYYNQFTGCESNPSTINNVALLASESGVSLTNLTNSSDSQVNTKKIYRSGGNGGVLYYLTQIGGSQTTFVDTFSDSALSTTLISYGNGAPQTTFDDCAGPFNQSMFWVNSGYGRVYYSRIGYPESVQNYIEVSSSDNPIQRLVIFGGDLYAIAEYNVYQIYGDNPYFVRQLAGVTGTKSPQSVVPTAKGIIWQASDGIRIFTGGAQSVILGHRALRPLFNGEFSENYSPIGAYQNNATFADGEYLFGSINSTFGLDLETGRVRDLGIPCRAIYYDVKADDVAISSGGRVLKLEDQFAGYADYTSAVPFEIKTRGIEFPTTSRVSRIIVSADVGGSANVYVQTICNGKIDSAGTLSTNSGKRTTAFDMDIVCNDISILIFADTTQAAIHIYSIEIEYFPVTMKLIGDDPIEINGHLSTGPGVLKFRLDEADAEKDGKIYKYERCSVDLATFGVNHTLYFKKFNGADTFLMSLNSISRRHESTAMAVIGPMEEFYITGQLSQNYLKFNSITVERSVVKMIINYADRKTAVEGYFRQNLGGASFYENQHQKPDVQKAYMFERLTILGNPNGFTWNTYINFYGSTPIFIGSDATAAESHYQYEIDRVGVLEGIDIYGTFSSTGSTLTGVELKAKPVMLQCRFGQENFQVEGHIMEGGSGVEFNFLDAPPSILETVYSLDRLNYDLGGNSTTATINLQLTGAGTAEIFTTDILAGRICDSTQIEKLGRVVSLQITYGSINDLAIYNIELIASPLNLDVYLNGKKKSVPAVLDNVSGIRYNLSGLMEESVQAVYLFERFLLDGNSLGFSIITFLKFVGGSYITLGTFSAANRRVQDFDIQRVGRLDELYLSGPLANGLYFTKFELVANAVTLRLIINGKVKPIPGRFRSYGQEIYFDIYSTLLESLTSSYIVNRFFYDIDPNSQNMVGTLHFVDGPDIEVFNRSDSSRFQAEIGITKKGRIEGLTIDSDWNQMFQTIHSLELDITAVNRGGSR